MSLEKIRKLKPAEHTYTDATKGDTRRITMSVMAQNINEIWPIDEYTILKRDSNGYFIVDQPHQLIFPLLKALQQLDEQVIELKHEIEILKNAR